MRNSIARICGFMILIISVPIGINARQLWDSEFSWHGETPKTNTIRLDASALGLSKKKTSELPKFVVSIGSGDCCSVFLNDAIGLIKRKGKTKFLLVTSNSSVDKTKWNPVTEVLVRPVVPPVGIYKYHHDHKIQRLSIKEVDAQL